LAKGIQVPKPRSVGRVVAARRLELPGKPDQAVQVRLGAPRRLGGGWDWGCPVEISGLGPPRLRYIFGVDAFQALQLGLNYIAMRLAAADPPPFWFKRTDGAGFARSIPTFLPLATQRRLERIIDQAGVHWAKRQQRAAAARRRGRR
jgi:hypothetical protein